MIRKVLPLLLFLTGIIPLGCCSEGPVGPYNLQMQGLQLLNSTYLHRSIGIPRDFLLPTGEAYTSDTLLVSPVFNFNLVAQKSLSLQYAAFALSCNEYPSYTDLKDKISAIEVYSDQPFNEVEAGESLNSKVSVVEERNGTGITVQEAIARINSIRGEEFRYSKLDALAITEKPADALTRTFTVHIKYASGREETATSAPMLWQ